MDTVIRLFNSNWTFLRNEKMKHEGLISCSDREGETWEVDMESCSRCHAKLSFCSFIWHSHVQHSPCFTVRLLQVKYLIPNCENQWMFWLLLQSEQGQVKNDYRNHAASLWNSQWLLSNTYQLLGRKEELMCTAEAGCKNTSSEEKDIMGRNVAYWSFFNILGYGMILM